MSTNVQKSSSSRKQSKMVKNGQKWSIWAKIVQDCQNGLKWSKNGQI